MGRVRRGMKIELNKNKIKFDSRKEKKRKKKKPQRIPEVRTRQCGVTQKVLGLPHLKN